MNFNIFAIAALGEGLSGSDRIFIEFAKRWSNKYTTTLHVWKEGYEMCRRQNLLSGGNLKFDLINVSFWCKLGFIICYFARIIAAVARALFLKLDNNKSSIIYSASEFWMDSLPAFILKIRYPKIIWVAAWFQTAPNPMVGFSEGPRKSRYRSTAFLYWLMQLPIKPLLRKYADFILVNNELERNQFSLKNIEHKVLVILGAVNTENINAYLKNFKRLPKVYDGVFQGRLHPQKGVLELIDIWKLVTEDLPDAKLIIIGDGPLRGKVEKRIKELNLENNIKLTGYVFDGEEKYRIFSQSKLVTHPAFYDSGGMASAEAMAFGLPCIGFDLDSYKSYYPKGMLKIKTGDIKAFASAIVDMLQNNRKRELLGKEAAQMILKNWSWDQRVENLTTILKAEVGEI